MKTIGLLGGLFMLLGSVCGIENVYATCSEYWIQVKVRRALFKPNMQPQIHELHLGNNCPATSVEPDYYEFLYTTTSCDIQTSKYPWGMLIVTFLIYEPALSNNKGIMPVYCFVQRNHSFRFIPKESNSSTYETSNLPNAEENSTLSQLESLIGSCSSSSFEGLHNSLRGS